MNCPRLLFFALVAIKGLLVLAMLGCVLSASMLQVLGVVFVALAVVSLAFAWLLILRERRRLATRPATRLRVIADAHLDPCEPEQEGLCG